MYSLCKNISCMKVKMSISTHFCRSAAVPSAPLDHQSCSLTGPEAFVFRLPPGRVSRFYPKSFNENRVVAEKSLAFQWFHQLLFRMAGLCDLILNAKHLKEAAKNIVSRWHSVRSPSQHGDQRRLKTSSTFSGRWVYPKVLQDLRPVLRHNTSAAVTSPWHSNKLKGCGHMHSLNSYKKY